MASGISAGHLWCDCTAVVTRIFESHCKYPWYLLPYLLLSTTHLGWGPSSHSLVIEVICAEVIKEFIHDLVVIHDLHNPLLQGQVVMRMHVCLGGRVPLV